jgi:hypothetical protein
MRHRLLQVGLLAILIGSWGCAAPRILGKTTMIDETTAPAAPAPAVGVTVNFINLTGTIEDSVVSVQSDAKGEYRSPELAPGKYSVEAMLPGFVIGKATVVLQKHGKKKAPFVLKKIREGKGKSLNESLEENLPNPGEVKIDPPSQ